MFAERAKQKSSDCEMAGLFWACIRDTATANLTSVINCFKHSSGTLQMWKFSRTAVDTCVRNVFKTIATAQEMREITSSSAK